MNFNSEDTLIYVKLINDQRNATDVRNSGMAKGNKIWKKQMRNAPTAIQQEIVN